MLNEFSEYCVGIQKLLGFESCENSIEHGLCSYPIFPNKLGFAIYYTFEGTSLTQLFDGLCPDCWWFPKEKKELVNYFRWKYLYKAWFIDSMMEVSWNLYRWSWSEFKLSKLLQIFNISSSWKLQDDWKVISETIGDSCPWNQVIHKVQKLWAFPNVKTGQVGET